MRLFVTLFLLVPLANDVHAQFSIDAIQTNFVLYDKRKSFDAYLRENTINKTFTEPLDSNSEYDYESACLTASQFMITSPVVIRGFDKLFAQYDSLQYSTKHAFLEALYGLYPGAYAGQVKNAILNETDERLFAMLAAYLLQAGATQQDREALQTLTHVKFTDTASITDEVLSRLGDYINTYGLYPQLPTPPVRALFSHQKVLKQKIIYSFQRWNRDYPGLAIVQNADGSFARGNDGQLLVFQQLARAASNLPYFITDGNTPQGIFSINGTAVSHNNFLGPTPNLQLVMPFEDDEAYWHTPFDSTRDSLSNYMGLLPTEWQNYKPMQEAFYAGKIGRTQVIAHGTTLDPAYFKDKPYYPLTPTEGCLCAREEWNTSTGKLLFSDQLNLVDAFLATPGETGYLFVINLDNRQGAVSREEIERLVNQYEKSRKHAGN